MKRTQCQFQKTWLFLSESHDLWETSLPFLNFSIEQLNRLKAREVGRDWGEGGAGQGFLMSLGGAGAQSLSPSSPVTCPSQMLGRNSHRTETSFSD